MGEKRGGIFGRCGYRICDRGRQAAMIGLNVHGSDLLAAPDQTPRKKKRSGHRSLPVARASAVGSGGVPACLLNPKQAVDASSCPRPRAQLPYPGVSSVSASRRRGLAARAVRCAEPREQPHMAAHGGAWSHDSRVGIGRPRRWNLPFVHLLGSLLAPGQPTSPPLPLCV